jgi:hypothetical protein
MISLAFSPNQNCTYINATSTSSPTLIVGGNANLNAMELKNRGTGEVFFKFGTTAATTVAVAESGYMLTAGERVVITRPTDSVNGWLWVDAVCASGQTAKVVIALGIGN